MSLRWGTAGHSALLALTALGAGLAVVALPPAASLVLMAVAVVLALAFIEPIGGLAVMLSVAPLKTLIDTEAEGFALPLDVGQLALGLLALAWLARKAARREPLWVPRSAVFLLVLIFVGAAALSLPGALSLGLGLTELLKWVEVALLLALTVDLIAGDRERLRWVVWAVLAAGGAHALVGLYAFFGGSGADHLAILGGTRYRAFGTFGQPNPFAGFMGVCTALGAGATWGTLAEWSGAARRLAGGRAGWLPLPWSALFYGALTALPAAALFASWSRGAWMGLTVAAALMLLFLPRRFLRGLLLVGAVAGLALLLAASGQLPGAVIERLTAFTDLAAALRDVRGVDVDDANYAEIERLAHWQAALGMAADHPWLGVGFGNYAAAYPAHRLINWPDALGHAHNYYLNLLAETGVVGLGAYLLLWGGVFAATVRALHRLRGFERGLVLGLLGVWMYLAVHSLLDKLYVNNVFLHIGVLFGILVALTSSGAVASRCESARPQISEGSHYDGTSDTR